MTCSLLFSCCSALLRFWQNDRWFCVVIRCCALVLCGSITLLNLVSVQAQPPGTPPPDNLWQGEDLWDGQLGGIEPEAFLFKDESGTPVVMPRMSFEEIDRLRRLDMGMRSIEDPVLVQAAELDGTIERSRAEWEVRIEMLIQPNSTRSTHNKPWVVPLELGGFHLLSPGRIELVGSDGEPLDAQDDVSSAYIRFMKPNLAGTGNDSNTREIATGDPASFLSVLDSEPHWKRLNAESESSLGYELVLPASLVNQEKSQKIRVSMQLSSRVASFGPKTFALLMRLPTATTRVKLRSELPAKTLRVTSGLLELTNTSDQELKGAQITESELEGSGGPVALLWSDSTEMELVEQRLLECESTTDIQWPSPESSPELETQLRVRNLSGYLDSFEVRLPEGMILTSPAEVVFAGSRTGGLETANPARTSPDNHADEWRVSAVENGNSTTSGGGFSLLQVRRSAVEEFDSNDQELLLRIRSRHLLGETSATKPWAVRLPILVDAVAQRGTIRFRTSLDHRVLFTPNPSVTAIRPERVNAILGDRLADDARVAGFEYQQSPFTLAVWLSQRQKLVRLQVNAGLAVNPQEIRLEMDLSSNGVGLSPAGLRLDMKDWTLIDITAPGQSEAPPMIEIDRSDTEVRWQVDASESRLPSQYRIIAQMPLDPLANSVEGITLPKLTVDDNALALTQGTVRLTENTQKAWLVDLASTPILQRERDREYRITNLAAPWTIRGAFAVQPLQLDLRGRTQINPNAGEWLIVSNWSIKTDVDLGGMLRFSVAGQPTSSVATASTRGDSEIAQAWTALVNGEPAIVREAITNSEATELADQSLAKRDVFEIVSPALSAGEHEIELFYRTPIQTPDPSVPSTQVNRGSDRIEFMLPVPDADDVDLLSPYELDLPKVLTDSQGQTWRISLDSEQAASLGILPGDAIASGEDGGASDHASDAAEGQWLLTATPQSVVRCRLVPIADQERFAEMPRAVIRSLIGSNRRHEHVLARLKNGAEFRIELAAGVTPQRIEVRLDGQPVRSIRESNALLVRLPKDDPSEHVLDLRVWVATKQQGWFQTLEPVVRLPVGSGLQYWQVVVPSDSHLFWASSQCGRAMRLVRDRLRLSRQPVMSDAMLLDWVVDKRAGQMESSLTTRLLNESLNNDSFAIPGNRYLFFAGDTFSFSMLTVSRTILWLTVGALLLLLAIGFQWFTFMSQPWVAVVLAVAVAGMLLLYPDAVVLTAQMAMLSCGLVAVFYTVSVMSMPRKSQRVLQTSSRKRDTRRSASSQRYVPPTQPSFEPASKGRSVPRSDSQSAATHRGRKETSAEEDSPARRDSASVAGVANTKSDDSPLADNRELSKADDRDQPTKQDVDAIASTLTHDAKAESDKADLAGRQPPDTDRSGGATPIQNVDAEEEVTTDAHSGSEHGSSEVTR